MVKLNNLNYEERKNLIKSQQPFEVQFGTDYQVDDILGVGEGRSKATNDALLNSDGALNQWVKQATFEYFVDRLTEPTKLLDISTVKRMEAYQHNLSSMFADVEFDGGRFDSGESKEFNDLKKIDPTNSLQTLTAKDLAIGAELKTNQLLYAQDSNLLSNFFGLIQSKVGNALERWCLYAQVGSELGDMGLTNGWLATLKQLSFDSNNQFGFTPLIYHDDDAETFLTKLENVEEKYLNNNGKDINLRWVFSSAMYFKLMRLLSRRETSLGDNLIIDNGVLRFNGVEIIKAPCLNPGNVRNGWNQLRVDADGLPVKTGGSLIDRVQYCLLTEPSNLVTGILPEAGSMISSQGNYDFKSDSYQLRIKAHADCTIYSPKDTLVIPYTANNKA